MTAKGTFSEEEKAAMKETIAERKRAKAGGGAAADLAACLEKIEQMSPADKALATKVHELITTAAPQLGVKTWYGMPAYTRDGKVVAFFKPGEKFKNRYCELGFDQAAQLDDGSMWPTAYALTAIGPAEEKAIVALIKKAAGD